MLTDEIKNKALSAVEEAYQQGYTDGKASKTTQGPPQGPQPDPPSTQPPVVTTQNNKGNLLYKIGLFSDIHFDNDEGSNPSYYLDDFKDALNYWKEQGVDMLCSCGDMIWNKAEELQLLYNTYKANINVPLYSCKGNHDMFLSDTTWNSLMIPENVSVLCKTDDSSNVPTSSPATIHMNIINNTGSKITLSDKVNFVLENPDRQGTFYGWKGTYNRESYKLVGDGNLITIEAGNSKSFVINTENFVGRNLLEGSRVKTIGYPANIMLYDSDGVSENIPVNDANSDVVFSQNISITVNIGGSNPSVVLRNGYPASYYVVKNNTVIVMLSPYLLDSNGNYDGKTHVILSDNEVTKLTNAISDDYMKMHNITAESLKNKSHDNFNYQFYRTDDLLALEELLENDKNMRVLIFTHYYFPHKSGNNNPAREGYYAHSIHSFSEPYVASVNGVVNTTIYDNNGAIIPHNTGAWWDKTDALCGVQFHYLNYLCNKYPNNVWFSGHSHISFQSTDEDKYLNVCGYDFEINEPSADVNTVKNEQGSIIINNYDANVYMRKSNTTLCKSAYAVHLPSLSRPNYITKDNHKCMFDGAEGATLEVYENNIILRYIDFKTNETKEYTL